MKTLNSNPHLFDMRSDCFKNSLSFISEWAGRTFEWLKSLSQQMRDHQLIACAILSTANLAFFSLMNFFGKNLEERINSGPQKLCETDRIFNLILIDGFVVGGAILAFNILLFTITNYPIRISTLAVITIAAIAIRTFFHLKVEERR